MRAQRREIDAMRRDNASLGQRLELNRQLDSIFPESAQLDTVPQARGLDAIPPQLRPR